jgi:RHS repeat-associated protein
MAERLSAIIPYRSVRHKQRSGPMPVTHYIWDEVDDTLLAETDEVGNTIAEYTHEPGPFGPLLSQRRNGHTYYHHYDGMRSTRALTDEAGNVTDTYTYDAWGNEIAHTGTTANPFRWVGYVGYYFDDGLGTFYIRARVYDPPTARWVSVDPIPIDGHPYTYAAETPVDFVDPSGLKWEPNYVPLYKGRCIRVDNMYYARHVSLPIEMNGKCPPEVAMINHLEKRYGILKPIGQLLWGSVEKCPPCYTCRLDEDVSSSNEVPLFKVKLNRTYWYRLTVFPPFILFRTKAAPGYGGPCDVGFVLETEIQYDFTLGRCKREGFP